jgi:hypothetical protein
MAGDATVFKVEVGGGRGGVDGGPTCCTGALVGCSMEGVLLW